MKIFPGFNLHYYSPADANNPNPGQRTFARKTQTPQPAAADLPPRLPPYQALPPIERPPLGIPAHYLAAAPGANPVLAAASPQSGQRPPARFGSYATSRARFERTMQKPSVNRDHPNIRTGASVLQFLGKHGSIETLSTGLARDLERRCGSRKTRPDWQDDNEITLERVFGLCWKTGFKSRGKAVVKTEHTVKKDALPIDSVSLEELNTVRGRMVMALTDSAGRMLVCGFQKAPEKMFLRGLPAPANEMWLDADGRIKAENPDDVGEDDQRIIAGQLYGTLLMEDDTFTSATPGKFLMDAWASNRKNDDAGDMKLHLISIEPEAGMRAKNAADDTSSPAVEPQRIRNRQSSGGTDFSPTVSGIGYLSEGSLQDPQERKITIPIVRALDERNDKPAPLRFGKHSGGLTDEAAQALAEAFRCEQIAEEDADHQNDALHEENAITDNGGAASASAVESSAADLPQVSGTGTLFDDLDSFLGQFSAPKK